MKKINRFIMAGLISTTGTVKAQTVGSSRSKADQKSFLGEIFGEEKPKPIPARPKEYHASFHESDFEFKPWLSLFKDVIVVNRAEAGPEKQSIKVYREGRLISAREVKAYLYNVNIYERDRKKYAERAYRIQELDGLIANADGTMFKVSTGRNQFEKKGTNHSQRDSWTTTPTGYYTFQKFSEKHKSEAYSQKLCDSFAAKALGAILDKEMCTMMEYAMFFNGGIALHKAIPGTEGRLGQKASGGCVRLPAALAEFLYRTSSLEQGRARVPVVKPDGSLVLNTSGDMLLSEKTSSVWGETRAWQSLIIVTDQVRQNLPETEE